MRSWQNILNNKILGLIGLCKKAGKVVAGAQLCEKEIRAGRSELIIVSEDISDVGRKAITDICTHYKKNFILCCTMGELGKAVGAAGDRCVVSVNDKGFSEAILKKYAELQLGRKGE